MSSFSKSAEMVSLIVPLYNGKKYISNVIEMVRKNKEYLRENDSLLDVELVFVNDSPWDEITKEEPHDITIKWLDNDSNVGIHQSRINGIKAAEGERVVFLDQDDEIEPNYVYSQYKNLGDGFAVICNGIKEGKRGSGIIYKDNLKASLINKQTIYLLAANQIVSPGQCMIRKSEIPEEWLKYPMHKNGSDDLYLWLLLLARGKRFIYNQECLYHHVDVGDNPSNDLRKMCESDAEMCRILRNTGSIPETMIKKRERLIEYIQKAGFKSRGNMALNLQYPDVAILKLFAYYI
ncbi:MAG: glycosyltransferase family 2 protein [Lachnospiraceae bacterium]|nr:glycosyltransferase family 2 protein [Lachnospiraceae bacterium]